MTFGSRMSITTGQYCIVTICDLAGKMPRVHWSMLDISSKRSIARFSTIPSPAPSCRSPIQRCRYVRPCTEPPCLVAVVKSGPLTRVSCEHKFGKRNELLKMSGPEPLVQ